MDPEIIEVYTAQDVPNIQLRGYWGELAKCLRDFRAEYPEAQVEKVYYHKLLQVLFVPMELDAEVVQ